MKLFEQYKLLQKPAKQAEKRWYDDEEFTSKAKSIKIVPNLSLNDLVRMRPERQMKRITYRDYLEFAHSKRLSCRRSIATPAFCNSAFTVSRRSSVGFKPLVQSCARVTLASTAATPPRLYFFEGN
ncbi:unnamed protein product [Trichogramma brassicae]|uniref:Uncharacterized protein n=1 Tax=Trichogramma brassicae TaxID=86971 RepID=A0A6H5IWM2_9HYME|nr:unnamed protein product [Trichogramma brassicae]